MERPLVSVVIPNWNGAALLPGCFFALSQTRWKPLEIIVVDNGSSDDSRAIFEAWRPRLPAPRWVGLGANVGFGGAVNEGARVADGRWIALLNNDAAPMPTWIDALVEVGESDPLVGMVAAKLLRMRRPDQIDKVGHGMYPDGLNSGRATGERDMGQWDEITETLFPDGAAGLYRRDMWEALGGFDPNLFAYGDDSDFGLRARWAGWRALVAPRSVVYHLHSATSGAYSMRKAFWIERHRIWLKWKLLPWPFLLAAPFFTLWRYGWQAYAALAGRGAAGRFGDGLGAPRLACAIIAAHLSALAGWPRCLKERRRILRERRIGVGEMTRLLWRHRIGARSLAYKE